MCSRELGSPVPHDVGTSEDPSHPPRVRYPFLGGSSGVSGTSLCHLRRPEAGGPSPVWRPDPTPDRPSLVRMPVNLGRSRGPSQIPFPHVLGSVDPPTSPGPFPTPPGLRKGKQVVGFSSPGRLGFVVSTPPRPSPRLRTANPRPRDEQRPGPTTGVSTETFE